MKLQFFAIPAVASEKTQEEFNRFVASHRVARVEKELIPDGAASFWSVCVTWIDSEGGTGPVSPPLRRGKEIDYRETLPPAEFVVFDRLRQLRKQLAAIVQQRVTTAAALGRIDGVGEGRVTRYGESVLAVMREVVATLTEPAPPAVTP